MSPKRRILYDVGHGGVAMTGSVLERRLILWRRQRASAIGVAGAARWLVSWAGLWLVLALADSVFALPGGARWAAFFLLTASAIAGLVAFVGMPLWENEAGKVLRAVSSLASAEAPYLLSAWELQRSGRFGFTSPDLAQAHIDEAQRRLSQVPERGLFEPELPRPWRRGACAVIAGWLLAGPWLYRTASNPLRLLTPWTDTPVEAMFEIEPGSARIAWGSQVSIVARRRNAEAEGAPELWLKSADVPWTRSAWDRQSAGEYSYQIPSLVRPTRYQLRWRRRNSRIYALDPAPYPSLADATARIHPPGSAGPTVQTISLQEGAELSALKGSWVVVSGKSAEPLTRARLVVSSLPSPIEFKAKSGGWLEAGFPLTQDMDFYFDLASGDGLSDPHPIHYRVRAAEDQPPSAEILSPAFDVDVSNREPLPITYEVRDDYGVAVVELAYRVLSNKAPSPNNGSGAAGNENRLPAERRVRIASYEHPRADSVGDYRWDLSALAVGETAEFWIRALDASSVGPQLGVSGKRRLRIVDFQAAHAEMERHWLDAEARLARAAEREAAARRALDALSKASPKDASALEASAEQAQRGLNEEWAEASRSLSATAEAAAQDPYANPGLAEELSALADEFSAVGAEQEPLAERNTAEKDWAAAAKNRAALENEAKKARTLLAKGHGLQAVQDLWNSAERMDEQGAELSQMLSRAAESGAAMTAEQRRALQDALKRIDEQMRDLAKTIEAMPKPKPGSAEDKRQKTIIVPLGAAQRTADALQKALEAGDYKEAARLAQRLSEELARVRRALAEAAAAESAGEGEGGEEDQQISAEMEAIMAAWQQAVEAQSNSLAQVRKVDESRVKSMLEDEKSLLRELAKRQKSALDEALRLGPAVPADVEVSMRAVLGEFLREEIQKAPQVLPQVALRLQLLAAASRGPESPRIAALAVEERAILEALEKGVAAPPMNSAQAAEADAAQRTQAGVRSQTADLERRLRDVAAKTSAIAPKTVDSLGEAQVEQSQAERGLGRRESADAVAHEQKALELLDRGLRDMSSALDRQRKMEQQMQSPFASPRGGRGRMRRTSGAGTGVVPLPSQEEYQPTPEIRKELKKSVEEPRPRAYDQTIKDYFKRISE